MKVHQRAKVDHGKAQFPGTGKEGGFIFRQRVPGPVADKVAVPGRRGGGNPVRLLPAGKGRHGNDVCPGGNAAQRSDGLPEGAAVGLRTGIFWRTQGSAPVPVVGAVPEDDQIGLGVEGLFFL